MSEDLNQYVVEKTPESYTLDFRSHTVEIQNTFAEMYHNNEIPDSVLG